MRPLHSIPSGLSDSLPISFTYSIRPGSDRVTLTIEAPEAWGAALRDGLALLASLTHEATKTLEAGYRDLRTQQTLSDLETKYQTIRAAYGALRASGLLHRAAVYALVSDASLPFHGVWKFADFNFCVRSVGKRSPVLRAVSGSERGPSFKTSPTRSKS